MWGQVSLTNRFRDHDLKLFDAFTLGIHWESSFHFS